MRKRQRRNEGIMEYKILVAEDDEDIVNLLKLYLENENFQVYTAGNGVEALEIIRHNRIDLAVLDIMMPQMDGYELIKKTRERYNFPIIILSAKNQDSDKILGLNIGADDYLTKPFNPLEIIARIHASLRRFYHFNENVKNENTVVYTVGELALNTETLTVTKNGKALFLTPTEYKILSFLMKSPGQVFTKAQIYEHINGEYFENDENTLMVHISKLREKIEEEAKEPKYIKTIRGLGYKIEKR